MVLSLAGVPEYLGWCHYSPALLGTGVIRSCLCDSFSGLTTNSWLRRLLCRPVILLVASSGRQSVEPSVHGSPLIRSIRQRSSSWPVWIQVADSSLVANLQLGTSVEPVHSPSRGYEHSSLVLHTDSPPELGMHLPWIPQLRSVREVHLGGQVPYAFSVR